MAVSVPRIWSGIPVALCAMKGRMQAFENTVKHPRKSLAQMIGECFRHGGAYLLAATAAFSHRFTWTQVYALGAASALCVVIGIVIELKRAS